MPVVTAGLIGKFDAVDALARTLLATGERILVEASPYDRIWGVGLKETDPLIDNAANWRGSNKLGTCLGQARAWLKQSRYKIEKSTPTGCVPRTLPDGHVLTGSHRT